MAFSDFTDEVQVKVYRSHVSIPVIALVPLAMLASLYCVVYFYANSNWFADEVPEQLNERLPGTFGVQEIVVEPSLFETHVYGAQIRSDPGSTPIITAPVVHAEVEPAFLLVGRLVFSEGRAEGAHVRLVFDEEGELNLLQALGVEPSDQPEQQTDGDQGLEIAFRALSAEDSSFEMVRPEFDFRVPDVDVDQVAITIGDPDLQMRAPRVGVPTVDFRFHPELFGFEPDYGAWEYTVEDVAVDAWRWDGDGFRVDSVEFYAEGVEAKAEGRMAFPDEIPDEAELEFRGRGELSVPYWSPLAQYFIRDTVHFEAPSLQVAAEGTLEVVDGRVRTRADLIDVAGLSFTDVEAEAQLRNQYITLERATADFYGGEVEANWAYFDMFEVAYAGEGSFRGVNPAAVLREYGVSLPSISGALSGQFDARGAVPMGREIDPTEPFVPVHDAMRNLAEVEMTDDWRFRPSDRSAIPAEEVRVRRGGRIAADYQRVAVPRAQVRAGDSRLDVNHFELDYDEMRFASPVRERAVDVEWVIPNVGPWVRAFGGEGLAGRSSGSLWANGPLAAPEGGVEARFSDGRVETERRTVGGIEGRLEAEVADGTLDVRELSVDSEVGNLSGRGTLQFARVAPGSEGPEWRWGGSQPVDAEWSIEELDLAVADAVAGGATDAEGRLNASGKVSGTVARPQAEFEVGVPRGEVRWLRFRQFELRGALDGGRLEVESLRSQVVQSGSISASGFYDVRTEEYQVEAAVEGVSLQHTKYLESVADSFRPEGNLEIDLHGNGTLRDPSFAGDVELRGLQVGERSLGDVALVVNTVDGTLYVSGAALPIGTLVFEVPLRGAENYYARFGVEHLDFARVFPAVGDLDWVESLEGTGSLEVTAEAGFSRYVVSVDMSSVRLETPNQMIRTEGPLRASLDSDNRLQIERASVGSNGHYIDLRGAVLLESYLTSLEVEGELDLGLVDLLGKEVFPGTLPESIVDSSGFVDVSMQIGGPPSRPIPQGSLTFRDATFELRDFATPLRIEDGHVQFDRDAVRVPEDRSISGEFLGGVYSVSGKLDVAEYRPEGAEIDVWTHNLVYRVPETANVNFDTDLTIQAEDLARPESWMVTGDVEILNARYFRDISLFEEQVAGRVLGTIAQRTERYEASALEQYPWLSEVGFDVKIRARDGFVIDNKIDRFGLDLEFRLDLRLQRTLQEPRLAGEVDVIDGTVDFQGETFEVRTGTLEYTGDPRNPRVEITAGADIRNQCVEQNEFDDVGPSFRFAGNFDESRGEIYHVLLRVEGRLETLNVQFESNPYADQRDILSLMLTGCTVDELSASGATQPGLEIALGPLLGRLEKEVQDVVELSEFTIMPGVERTQVRIADRVTRRLQWRFQLDTGVSERSGGQRYQLEYQLSDRWSAEFSERSTGERENFLLDAKLKYRVPID